MRDPPQKKQIYLVWQALSSVMDALISPYDRTTPQTAEITAAQQVLSLPELLETILLRLPIKDLILSQRVNTCFRATVTLSPALQRALFFMPNEDISPRTSGKYPFSPPAERPVNNRLLLRVFPGHYPTVTLVLAHDSSSPEEAENSHGTETWRWDVCISFPAPPSAPPSPSSKAVHYPEASWRRMFLCQPPCRELYLVKRYQRSRRVAVAREGGIRMGEFVESVGEGTVKARWWELFRASDGDWHFEGTLGKGGG
jgi:hypothetical protein